MLSSKSVLAYREQFGNRSCMFAEPSSRIMITDERSGASFISPANETDESFSDRLERSKTAGVNLFYEEWEPLKLEDGVLY